MKLLCCLLVSLVCAELCLANGDLFGVSYGNSFSGNRLYKIDDSNGTGEFSARLADYGIGFLNALASRDRETLFTVGPIRGTYSLVTLNPTTTPVEIEIGPPLSARGGLTGTSALAYHAEHGLLGITGGILTHIDTFTGETEEIGRVGDRIGIQGLAFSPDGALYGWGVNRFGLIRINPSDASYSVIGGGPSGFIQSLEFSPDGSTLYGAGEALYSIDTRSGSRSIIGSGAGFSDVRGIAFAVGRPIPEPSSIILASLLSLMICMYWRGGRTD